MSTKTKSKKRRKKKRKFSQIDDIENDNPPSKKLKLNEPQLTQSVCCPICIVDLSTLSKFDAECHMAKCTKLYEEMKKQRIEPIDTMKLIQNRRQQKIKHNKVVNEWKNIFGVNKNKNNKKKAKSNKYFNKIILKVPAFKQIKGTNIVVDAFNYKHSKNIIYFLSHFHYDHYIGINNNWNNAPIYCSNITAKLLNYMFKIPLDGNVIRILPMNKRVFIPNSNPKTFVTLNDSNHIKGSVMFLFQVTNIKNKNKYTNHNNNNNFVPQPVKEKIVNINGHKNLSMHNWLVPAAEPVQVTPVSSSENLSDNEDNAFRESDVVFNDLHVGDFRADLSMFDDALCLNGVSIRNLYLDTTYFNPKYKFPPHTELFKSLKNILNDIIKKYSKKVLFMIGTYFVGKEKLLIFLSKTFKQKICINKTKKKVLQLLEFNNDEYNCFTIESNITQFHTISLNDINYSSLKKILNSQKNQYNFIVGIKATGWSKNVRKIIKENVMTINIPYSEHSNFMELKMFVNRSKPRNIIPTVNIEESNQYLALFNK